MTKEKDVISSVEKFKSEVLNNVNSSEKLFLDPKKTLLLVVDMVNDSNRQEGFLAKGGSDISMELAAESASIKLINRCKEANLPVCYVKPIYDFSYLLKPMKQQFEASGLPDMLFKKGEWGSEFIDTLPEPDLVLIKSHFSSFSPHSFVYSQETNSQVKSYLDLPEKMDSYLKDEGKKIMSDFFLEAQKNHALADKSNIDNILDNEVVSFHAYLESKEIDTLIIIGGSTHVCVDAAISGATERGYRIILPVDAMAAEDPTMHWTYLKNLSFFKGVATNTDKVNFNN